MEKHKTFYNELYFCRLFWVRKWLQKKKQLKNAGTHTEYVHARLAVCSVLILNGISECFGGHSFSNWLLLDFRYGGAMVVQHNGMMTVKLIVKNEDQLNVHVVQMGFYCYCFEI